MFSRRLKPRKRGLLGLLGSVFMLFAGFGLPGALHAAEGEPKQAADWWLVRPRQTDPKILAWAAGHPKLVTLDSLRTLDGHTAYAVTVTDPTVDENEKRKVFFAQPHAHEPAATAGMMDFLAQLIDGKHLDGRPTDLNSEELLRRTVLTFIPDGNPDGRVRAPTDWWDGRQFSNDVFLKYAFGHQSDGRRCKRVGRFNATNRRPARIGIVYERIGEHVYVEPNRDLESTYFKLVRRALDRRDYDLMVDLHQTEFARSKCNASVILPFMQDDLSERIRRLNLCFGEAVIEAWRKVGGHPVPKPRPLGYGEEQLQYFRKCWSDIYENIPCLVVEVQNNNLRTPPRKQMELIETSIRASVERSLDGSIIADKKK